MLKITASELARKLSDILDRLEYRGEEFAVLRNGRPIARLVPGTPYLTALEAMGDLYRTLSPSAGAKWLKDGRMESTLERELEDPWAS